MATGKRKLSKTAMEALFFMAGYGVDDPENIDFWDGHWDGDLLLDKHKKCEEALHYICIERTYDGEYGGDHGDGLQVQIYRDKRDGTHWKLETDKAGWGPTSGSELIQVEPYEVTEIRFRELGKDEDED